MLQLPARLRSQIDLGRSTIKRAFARCTSNEASRNAITARENATTGQAHFPASECAKVLMAVNATELASIQSEADNGDGVIVSRSGGDESRRCSRGSRPLLQMTIDGVE